MEKALDAGKGVDGDMAQVIEGGEFGVLFEGEVELRGLHALVEYALASTQSCGVTVGMLNGWHAALEEALTAPRDEEEMEEEEKQKRILTGEMEILPPEASTPRSDDVCECGDMFWRHRREIAQIGNSPTLEAMYFCSNRRGTFVKEKVGDNSGKAPVRARRREE